MKCSPRSNTSRYGLKAMKYDDDDPPIVEKSYWYFANRYAEELARWLRSLGFYERIRYDAMFLLQPTRECPDNYSR